MLRRLEARSRANEDEPWRNTQIFLIGRARYCRLRHPYRRRISARSACSFRLYRGRESRIAVNCWYPARLPAAIRHACGRFLETRGLCICYERFPPRELQFSSLLLFSAQLTHTPPIRATKVYLSEPSTRRSVPSWRKMAFPEWPSRSQRRERDTSLTMASPRRRADRRLPTRRFSKSARSARPSLQRSPPMLNCVEPCPYRTRPANICRRSLEAASTRSAFSISAPIRQAACRCNFGLRRRSGEHGCLL